MKVPPMKPSAIERRAKAREAALKKWDDENHNKAWPFAAEPYLAAGDVAALEDAHRDGYAAGVRDTLAMLRYAPFGLRVAMQNAEALARPSMRTFAGCDAAAAWLEAHPNGDPDDPDNAAASALADSADDK